MKKLKLLFINFKLMSSLQNNIDINLIWNQFDNLNINTNQNCTIKQNKENNKENKVLKCTRCNNSKILENTYETVCNNCGLVLNSDFCSNLTSYETNETPIIKKTYNANASKLKKMQEWYMWSNDEKAQYKLSLYTKDLCQKLEIHETIIENICETVYKVMDAIKKQDGTKRARVKDGIILVCIQYVYTYFNENIHKPSAIDLSKKLNLDIKYITKAEKIVLELINKNPTILNKSAMVDIKKPMDYVYHVNNKYNLQISKSILDKVEYLINKCESNDILLDHTPLSIGVCCLYYILKHNNITIDLKIFSNIYNLSVVTVMKTYNKLKNNEHILLN